MSHMIKNDNNYDKILPQIEEETEQQLLGMLQNSEIDIDEYVTRSIRKADKSEGTDIPGLSTEVGVADVYTVNSKILPSLAENFQPNIPPETKIPDFTSLTPEKAIECLGELIGIDDHEVNFISFWTLDTLAGCLQTVQNKNMSEVNQKALIAWFGFILKTISIHGWTREKTFSDFKKLILIGKDIMEKGSEGIPLPNQCLDKLNHHSSTELSNTKLSETKRQSNTEIDSVQRVSSKSIKVDKIKSASILSKSSNSDETISKNITDLEMIAESIYEIFANTFKFEVIKSAFTNASNITTVCLPHPLHLPKSLEPQEEPGLKKLKDVKGKSKKNKKSMQLEETPEVPQIDSDKYILPLSKAKEVDKTFFATLFPEQTKAKAAKQTKTKGKKK